ncbi:(2Fe-2S)-binding protein, partial [Streptomyces sp. SID14436]
RVSCCMFYTVRPEDICATCPRTCATARTAGRATAQTAKAG